MPYFNSEFFGIAAGITSLVSSIPYIWSIFKGRTKPSGASWWTWSLLTWITVLSSWFGGAPWQILVLPLWLCLNQTFVAVLSLKRGDNNWDKLNKFCVAGACLGVGLWLITGQPLIALVISITADFLASVPNFRHVWKSPKQEDKLGWTLGWLSALFEFCAISVWSLAGAGWASYFFLSMTITIFLIWRPALKTLLPRTA